uniref:Uncharacterized protein n=1 Tax=Eutreptiella gymnastica TaxID=73025 RepID=A0A7S1I5G6_9EUGL
MKPPPIPEDVRARLQAQAQSRVAANPPPPPMPLPMAALLTTSDEAPCRPPGLHAGTRTMQSQMPTQSPGKDSTGSWIQGSTRTDLRETPLPVNKPRPGDDSRRSSCSSNVSNISFEEPVKPPRDHARPNGEGRTELSDESHSRSHSRTPPIAPPISRSPGDSRRLPRLAQVEEDAGDAAEDEQADQTVLEDGEEDSDWRQMIYMEGKDLHIHRSYSKEKSRHLFLALCVGVVILPLTWFLPISFPDINPKWWALISIPGTLWLIMFYWGLRISCNSLHFKFGDGKFSATSGPFPAVAGLWKIKTFDLTDVCACLLHVKRYAKDDAEAPIKPQDEMPVFGEPFQYKVRLYVTKSRLRCCPWMVSCQRRCNCLQDERIYYPGSKAYFLLWETRGGTENDKLQAEFVHGTICKHLEQLGVKAEPVHPVFAQL